MKNDKKEKSIILLILMLITLIILIFLLINYLGKINHKPQIPTGNVDIFEIIFKNDNLNSNETNNNSIINYGDNGNTIETPENINHGNGKLVVYDEKQKYSNTTKLEIFKHASYYIVDGLIAPGAENSYQFVIRNNNSFNINYKLDFIETNDHNINMKYRLKLNGKYVVGNNNEYVELEKLNNYTAKLDKNSYDVYTLDWKWFESDNDTYVGTQIQANYKMNLKISAEI